jgi:hypothetical protein
VLRVQQELLGSRAAGELFHSNIIGFSVYGYIKSFHCCISSFIICVPRHRDGCGGGVLYLHRDVAMLFGQLGNPFSCEHFKGGDQHVSGGGGLDDILDCALRRCSIGGSFICLILGFYLCTALSQP